MTTATLHRPGRMAPRTVSYCGVITIVAAVAVVAVSGAALAVPAIRTWYPDMPKPVWTPSAWLFALTWAVIYTVMAVAASVVWLSREREDMCCPLGAFSIMLGLKLTWSVCFFGLHSPLLGFIDSCLLWIAAGVALAQFFLVSRLAGWLMAPVWVWVTFAGALNASIILLGG